MVTNLRCLTGLFWLLHPRVPRVPLYPSDGGGSDGGRHPERGVRDFNLQAWTLGKELSTVHGCACSAVRFIQVDMRMCAYACASLCPGQLSPWSSLSDEVSNARLANAVEASSARAGVGELLELGLLQQRDPPGWGYRRVRLGYG